MLKEMLAMLAMLFIGQAHSATFCVDTEAEAQAAFNAAKNNGQVDTIKFESGTYALVNTLKYETFGAADHLALIVYGGYNTGCTQLDGNRTVLDGQNLVRVLNLSLDGADTVSISRLTFFRGRDASGFGIAANLIVGMNDQAGGATVFIDGNRIVLGSSPKATGGVYVGGWGTLYMRNNLISFNEGVGTPAASIYLYGEAFVAGNTIHGNNSVGGEGSAFLMNLYLPSSHASLSNNISWGNDTGLDLFLGGDGLFELNHNDFGLRNNNFNLDPDSGGDVSVDPQFADCGFLCLDLPLMRSSPLIDYGDDAPPGGMPSVDLLGTPRTVGTRPDVGAYELDRLFDDDFD